MKINKKILIIVLLIIIIIISVYIYKTLSRYKILKDIRDSIAKFEKCNNYMFDDFIRIIYYKDGITKEINDINDGSDFTWSDGEFVYYVSESNKQALKQKASECNECQKVTFEELNIHTLTNEQLLKMALDPFSIKISEKKFSSKNTKKLDGVIILKINKELIIYIDIDTKLPIFYESEQGESNLFTGISQGVVTDKDVEFNMSEYEIHE